MVEIICALIAAVATIMAAATARKVSHDAKRSEARAERRAQESRLAMELMYATCSLSLVTAKKLAGMHTNGDVEEAMDSAEQAQQKYMDFCREQAAKNFAKV